jgi:preprotein translocase subunit SecE
MAVAEKQAEKEAEKARAEKKKVEKVEAESERPARSEAPSGIAGVLSWPGRKLAEGRAFFSEVRSELKKVTWPSRKEVYSTTIVVIATSVLFGFYLWGLDLVFSQAMSVVLGHR